MAKITIREVDSTNPGVSATNPDVAYVPGYAIKGPVNTPTLCENLSTFQNLFGTRPYMFKQAQAYPSEFDSKAKPKKVMYEEDDYEKSYIYACELLSLGLPVIFERILPDQEIEDVTYTSEDLTAKIYFTKESFIIPADQAFGTHEVTEGESTVDMPNIYENEDGDLVYYNSTEGETEKIVLIISAPYPGSIYSQVTVNYNSFKLNNESSTSLYDQFVITPTDLISNNAEPEIINFTCNKEDVDLEIPEQIKYYKDIESAYVKFEWLKNLDSTFGYIEPIAMKVLGSYWRNSDPAPTLPQANPVLADMEKYIDAAPLMTHNYGLWAREFLYIPGGSPAGRGVMNLTYKNGENKDVTVKCYVHYNKADDKYCFTALESGSISYKAGDNPWNPTVTVKNLVKGTTYEVTPQLTTDSLGNTYIARFTSTNPATAYAKTAEEVENMPFAYTGANSEVMATVDFPTYMESLQGLQFDFDGDVKIDSFTAYLTGAWYMFQGNGSATNNPAANHPTKFRVFCKNPDTGYYEPENKEFSIIMKTSDITEDYFNQKFEIKFDASKITSSVIITQADPSGVTGKFAFAINGVKFTYANNTFDNSKTGSSHLYVPEVFETHDEFTVDGLYKTFTQRDFFNKEGRLTDKGEYQIKYLTSGAYPVFEYSNNLVADNFLACAAERGDCVAIIDHTNNVKRAVIPDGSNTVFDVACEYFKDKNPTAIYGTMFTPWYRCNCGSVGQTLEMPASLAYLTAFAQSIKNYPNFLATAGAVRGVVPNFVSPCQLITNALADTYQPRNNVSINAITNIKPYGNLIWGNRTLKNNAVAGNLTAQSFLNVRNMSSDIKKVVYTTSKSLTFEQNSDITWGNFKAKIVPTLDKLQAGNGISGYQILKQKTTEKAKIVALIKIFPIEPVEDFDITIELSDAGVSIS